MIKLNKGIRRSDNELKARRAAILDATAKLIAQNSYAYTTAEQISDAVNPKLPYRELGNLFPKKVDRRSGDADVKQRIVVELFKRMWSEFRKLTDEHLDAMQNANSAIEAKEALMSLYRGIVGAIQQFGDVKVEGPAGRRWGSWGVTFIMETRTPETENVEGGFAVFANRLDAVLTAAQDRGFLRKGNIPALRQLLIGTGETVLAGWFWAVRGQESYPANYTLQDAVDWFEKLLDGIIVPASTESNSNRKTQKLRNRKKSPNR